ncbi:hypothetical protein SDC9_173172 [bioreactor metagenome]|uniref:Uncharacterized protein n=1 Tax=bioreactor metagenome TaxID=1076179 RepID=A0A645GFR5_9ZZZZ
MDKHCAENRLDIPQCGRMIHSAVIPSRRKGLHRQQMVALGEGKRKLCAPLALRQDLMIQCDGMAIKQLRKVHRNFYRCSAIAQNDLINGLTVGRYCPVTPLQAGKFTDIGWAFFCARIGQQPAVYEKDGPAAVQIRRC